MGRKKKTQNAYRIASLSIPETREGLRRFPAVRARDHPGDADGEERLRREQLLPRDDDDDGTDVERLDDDRSASSKSSSSSSPAR